MDFNCRVIWCDILLKGLFLHINIDHSHQKACPRNNHLNPDLALWSLDENLLRCMAMAPCLSSIAAGDVCPHQRAVGEDQLWQNKAHWKFMYLFFLWDHEPADRARSAVPQLDTEQSKSRGGLHHTAALVLPSAVHPGCSFATWACTKIEAPWAGAGGMAWGITGQKGQSLLPVGLGTQRPRTQRAGACHASWRGFNSQS